MTTAVVRSWSPAQRARGLRRCRRCGLGSDIPGVTLDDAGECSVCARFDSVAPRTTGWFRNPDDLDEQRDRARRRSTGDYDCLHLLSGGKDSSYALYQLVERGWRVHALTLDNGFIAEGAKANIRRSVADLGITHEFVTTEAMNEIFRDSLERFANVCNGCYKTIYTLAVARAHELGIPVIVTGLSRGQFFETRLVPHQFEEGRFDPEAIDRTVLQARRTYHHTRDAVTALLPEQAVFESSDVDVLSEIEFVDFYRYVDVSLAELYEFLENRAPWVRPADTGRSTNCLVNVAGIFVHQAERGYHNYAEPYSWDVRLGHKTRAEALEELDDEIDQGEVDGILAEIGYRPKRPEILTAWYLTADGEPLDPTLLRAHLRERIPERAMPSAFVHLDDLPLADSAKVDVSALPAPARRAGGEGEYVPPDTATEAAVADVWSAVLDTSRVGIDDDFFDLGGASLSALEAVVALEDRLGVVLPDAFVFEHRTVRQFAAAVEDLDPTSEARDSIPQWDGAGPTPLTEGEEGILFECRADPDEPRYNVTRLYEFESVIDLDRLHDAFRTVVSRHEALRTAFDAQRSFLPVDAALSFEEFPDDDHHGFAERQARVPFDLDHGPLVRVHAGTRAGGVAGVLVVVHHVAVDAESFDLLWAEVDDAYHGRPLPELGATLASHAAWQRSSFDESADFWAAQRAASVEAAPARIPAPAAPEPDGYVQIEAAVSTSELAATGSTPFAASLAAAAITLSRYSRTGHVDLGVTSSRKDHPDVANTIGYFLNTLPFTVDVDEGGLIHDVVVDAGRTVAAALPHRAYPSTRMLADARRDGGRVPDISFMLAYQQLAPASFGDTRADHEILPSGVSVTDLTLLVEERGEKILVAAEYRGATIGRARATQLLDAFATALVACCRRPHHAVVSLRGSSAQPDLVGPVLDDAPLVLDQILEQARSTPDRLAVRAIDGRSTYRDVVERAAAIGSAIRGAAPGASRVGVAVHRNSDLLPAILGVWFAGAAYVPLDPTVPAARRERIVAAADLDVVVGDADVAAWCPVESLIDLAQVGDTDDSDPVEISADDPAYVIFTSGSTGVPAGVVVTHGNLAASTGARPLAYGPVLPERFLLTSSIGFDSSMVGLFWPLSTGGAIVLAGEDEVPDIDRLAALVDRHDVTHLLMVPSLYRVLLDRHARQFGSLKVAIVAGESCPSALVEDHTDRLPGVDLYNEYGPTEATVWASVHRCRPGEEPVPIGSPIPGARLRVVDTEGRPMASGAAGELWISGPGVAAGYVSGRDESAFVVLDGVRWYRTGDLVRVDAGTLLFLGRIDDQLNVGGVRLEPEEIESAITGLKGVSDAAVVARAVEGRSTLVAYVVADEDVTSPTEIRRSLAGGLGAAAPRVIVFTKSLPRTVHGKLDRSTVAEMPLPRVRPLGDSRTDAFVALWQRALADPTLGPDDDFFAAGGDSLAAAEIVAATSDLVGRDVPIGLLLRCGSPRALARELGVTLEGADATGTTTLRSGSSAGPVAVVIGGDMAEREELADALPDDTTVLTVPLDGVPPGRMPAGAVVTEVALRAGARPVGVVGWRAAGQVAHEVGRLLAVQGTDVQFVGLVDPLAPEPEAPERSRPGPVKEAVGGVSAQGRRLLGKYGTRVRRAGLALRGQPIPPAPTTAAPESPVIEQRRHPSDVALVLYAQSDTGEHGLREAWRRWTPDVEVVVLEGSPWPDFIAADVAARLLDRS